MELRRIDYLAYPSTFEETSCLSVIESLVAGCRVVCPSLGALPEAVGPYARLYPSSPTAAVHAELFASILEDELAKPSGRTLRNSRTRSKTGRARGMTGLPGWGMGSSDRPDGGRRPAASGR